jgi:hypothetical protein
VLAGPVEMHLQQIVLLVAQGERAALGKVELDGVAVVDDGVGALLPAQLQRRQLRLDRCHNIDRRLLQADGAGLACRIEITPFRGAGCAFVAPMRALGGEGRLA